MTGKTPPKDHKIRGLKLEVLTPERRKLVATIADVVLNDPDLDLFIRDGYLNVYYRGGNLWKIKGLHAKTINIHFDNNYLKVKVPDNFELPDKNAPFDQWIVSLVQQKFIMNNWFVEHEKKEREIQHSLCTGQRTNSDSPLLIIDIEYAAWFHGSKDSKGSEDSRRLCRFDMIAIERQDIKPGKPLILYLMELKQGDNAIHGASGLQSHLEDFNQFLENELDKKARDAFYTSMRNIITERVALGLLPSELAEMNLDAEIEIRKSVLLYDCKKFDEIKSQLQSDIKVINYADVEPH